MKLLANRRTIAGVSLLAPLEPKDGSDRYYRSVAHGGEGTICITAEVWAEIQFHTAKLIRQIAPMFSPMYDTYPRRVPRYFGKKLKINGKTYSQMI